MGRAVAKTTEARFARFLQPVLEAIRDLGGSGRPAEVKERIIQSSELDPTYLNSVHKGGESVFGNDVDWARFYLVRGGYLDASKRGVWTLTEKGRSASITDLLAAELLRTVDRSIGSKADQANDDREAEPPLVSDYSDQTLRILRGLAPGGFERLAQRLLRESGFEEVHVTGRTNDGGIDGDGILKVNPFVSFRVLFQCKRWKSAVGPEVIRDFRGAMMGRADKGIIITTAYFTPHAEREASRDGAPPIELVDGEGLVEILAQLGLGLVPKTTYDVEPSFFEQFQ